MVSRIVPSISARRSITTTPPLAEEEKIEGHEASFARTDPSVQVEYIEKDLPSSTPVQGRGGMHFRRTLASFSLEGRVGIVTGGARGLGLVMSQAMVISGADVAIVDLNSKSIPFLDVPILCTYSVAQRRRHRSKQISLSRNL